MLDQESIRVRVLVTGRVQGVGFRYGVVQEARARNLAGWVRNLDMGQVEAVFEGPRREVEAMVAWCRQGPPGSYVRETTVREEPPEGTDDFSVRPTAARAE